VPLQALNSTAKLSPWIRFFNAPTPYCNWFTIHRIGDVMLVQSPSGESWILGPERPDDRLPAGMGFVIMEEEIK
jgi:hypothetical protein